MRRLTSFVLAAVTTTAAAAAAGPPAHASVTTFMSLISTTKSVTTSTGAKLHLTLSAFEDMTSGSTSKANTTISLATGSPLALGETHSWTFQLSRSSFVYKSSTGKATLKTGSQLSPYGSLSLTFTRSSSKKTSCSGGSLTTTSGSLSGIVHFVTNTGSKGWGTVGSATKAMSFSTPDHLTVASGCASGTGGSAPCATSTVWNAPSAGVASVSGSSTRSGSTTISQMTASRTANLSKPAHATRLDWLVASEPAPAVSGGVFSITTRSGGPVTGSAKLDGSSNATPFSYPCKSGSTSHTANATSYSGPWTTPSAGLVFHFRVTGNLVTASSGTGYGSVTSYS